MITKDIAIIGAGPSGLYAGFYAGFRGLSAVIIDKLAIPGGQLSALYPEKIIYDLAGHEEIKAQAFVDNLVKQSTKFETTSFSLENDIISISKVEDGSFLLTGSTENIKAKTIVIAIGNGAFSPRKIGVTNETEFDNIHYFVNDLAKFDGKNVAILGGGDSALDWALTLNESAKKVHLIHRRNEFRAHAHSVDLLYESSVNKHTPFIVSNISGSDGKAHRIKLQKIDDETITKVIEVEEIIVNYGFVANIGNAAQWGVEFSGKKIVAHSNQSTSVDGIFAIGDICHYHGKSHTIMSGLGEVPHAVNSCYSYIYPDKTIGPLFSSIAIK